jgi:hypothetical protein
MTPFQRRIFFGTQYTKKNMAAKARQSYQIEDLLIEDANH